MGSEKPIQSAHATDRTCCGVPRPKRYPQRKRHADQEHHDNEDQDCNESIHGTMLCQQPIAQYCRRSSPHRPHQNRKGGEPPDPIHHSTAWRKKHRRDRPSVLLGVRLFPGVQLEDDSIGIRYLEIPPQLSLQGPTVAHAQSVEPANPPFEIATVIDRKSKDGEALHRSCPGRVEMQPDHKTTRVTKDGADGTGFLLIVEKGFEFKDRHVPICAGAYVADREANMIQPSDRWHQINRVTKKGEGRFRSFLVADSGCLRGPSAVTPGAPSQGLWSATADSRSRPELRAKA